MCECTKNKQFAVIRKHTGNYIHHKVKVELFQDYEVATSTCHKAQISLLFQFVLFYFGLVIII